MTDESAVQALSENLFLFRDTCNVYVLRSGNAAVLIDFGAGAVLDHLAEMGVERVTDVLLTHHHRDQAQGLARAAENGIRIWVPHQEQDFFHSVDAHWQAREIYNNYNMRQDRFSLLDSISVNGTLQDYANVVFSDYIFTVVPTPGHTTGSITLMAEVDGQRVAFSGDLIAAPGKVWSMAATQWSYNGVEGVAASIPSLLDLKKRQPTILLPSHGDPIETPAPAIDLLIERFGQLLQLRQQNPRIFDLSDKPYEAITPHLLKHRASVANSFVLLSESGKALMIDFGYDFVTGIASGTDRASRRPWLYTIPALKEQFRIDKIDVVLPTHYHDDHVAGINLLSRVEGTQVWAADLFADILENPSNYDLPCLWYDPIPVDRRLPLETPFQWEEYTFTLYPLPGHTRYAVAIYFEVDGQRIIAGGDQYQSEEGVDYNYVYPNRFAADDYVKSAELYQELKPDWIITGHWQPRRVTPDYLEKLLPFGQELERLHHELLSESPNPGADGLIARLSPYHPTLEAGKRIEFQAEITNPFAHNVDVFATVVAPAGWIVLPESLSLTLDAHATSSVNFAVITAANAPVRRARLALDVTIGGQHFGQLAEALITTI
jgi:glyoxylase-like metal-dependent hydrolase (beta-lactamase superfamily II)